MLCFSLYHCKYFKCRFLIYYLIYKSQPWLVILVLDIMINYYLFFSCPWQLTWGGGNHLFWFKTKWGLAKVVRNGSLVKFYVVKHLSGIASELSVNACEYVCVCSLKSVLLLFAPSFCLLLPSGKAKSAWRATECKEAHSQLFLKSWLLPFTTSWS